MRRILYLCGVAAVIWAGWVRPWRRRVPPSQLLDELVPGAQFRDTITLDIAAPPEDVFRAFREVTLRDMPLAWAIGELRYLPGRLRGSVRPTDPDRPFVATLEADATSPIIAEQPDRELVIGSIGRLHDPLDQAFVPLPDGAAFRAFDTPGYEKLAMSLRALPAVAGTPFSMVILEHRTLAIGEEARKRFQLYWLGIRPGGALVTHLLLRAVRRRAETPWLAVPGAQMPPESWPSPLDLPTYESVADAVPESPHRRHRRAVAPEATPAAPAAGTPDAPATGTPADPPAVPADGARLPSTPGGE